MAAKTKFQAIRGTRDLLPPETALWNHVERTAHEVFGTFGFGEIRPPIFEPTELFARSIGLETDVVSKEMYTFHDPAEELVEILINVLRFAEEKGITFGFGSDYVETPAKVQRILSEQPLLRSESVTLRPEATASVCRAYIEHGMQQLPQPVKLYYLGPMFRR